MKDGLDETAVERIWKHSVLPYVEERLFGEGDRLGQFDLEQRCEEEMAVIAQCKTRTKDKRATGPMKRAAPNDAPN